MKIPQLHFTRFLAAFSVVIFHFGLETWPFTIKEIHTIFTYGNLAVSFFFCLSGFILAVVYSGQPKPFPVKKYFVARFARIYPIYILTFLITLVLISYYNDRVPRMFSVFLQVFGLHAWVPGECLEINFPGWSISVEIFFYLVLPFLVLFFQRFGKLPMGIFAVLLWAVSAVIQFKLVNYSNTIVSPTFGDFLLRNPALHLNGFVLGFAAGAFFLSDMSKWRVPAVIPVLMYSLGTLLFFGSYFWNNDLGHYGTNGLFAPVFVLIILGLSMDKSPLSRLFSHPFFVMGGEMSYAVYLLQCPVILAFKLITGNHGNLSLGEFWLYMLILIVTSFLSFKFVEGPARKMIRRWAKE